MMGVDDSMRNVATNYALPSSGPPNVIPRSGAGAGATVVIEGNNRSGVITFTTGAGLSAGGDLFTLTLADSMAFPTRMNIVFNTLDDTTAGILTNLFISAATAASATLRMKGVALNVNTTYKLSYSITGY